MNRQKILFCDQDEALPSAPPWAMLPLNLAAALAKRGHEVYAPLPKHQHARLWKESINFVGSVQELEGTFDIVQGHKSLRQARKTTEIAEKLKARPFQWVINNIFMSWNDVFYAVRYELPILIFQRNRTLGHLLGLVPRSLRVPKKDLPQLIVPTRYLKDELTNTGLEPNTISIAPLWVNTNLFSPIDKETRDSLKKKLGLRKKVILLFGGYTALRGINTTIKMFDIIKKEKNDVQLVFGLWNAPNPFQGYLNLGLRTDLFNIINLADVVCVLPRCTHQMRTMPSTLMEAMSCGRAVVSTNVEGIPELIDNGRDGILIDYEKEWQVVQESARVVIELLENDTMRQELGKNAREKMVAKYAIEHAAKCFESIYMSALEE